ncbi:hypothetical protein ABEB36_005098 [Hypothenemus hampei]
MRVNMRVGKRFPDVDSFDEGKRSEQKHEEENLDDNYITDYKRSAPQFLLHPRVGKTDKTWRFHSFENIQKRSDPKATDLWFGPRIGRSIDDQFEDIPWVYVILNGNRLQSNIPLLKSNDDQEQSRNESGN